ncbi:hypothetical protein [Winogradskyella sp.]|uniref:hypothetical protein n=1 Tax=Winogradskyella sp. TaxID=1883156 RepID=UPI0026138F9B|nr:hypothetical protein [Winogradskyella sp.]
MTYHKKQYQKIDSIQLNEIRICKKRNKDTLSVTNTDGDIIFDLTTIKKSLEKSLNSRWKNIQYYQGLNDEWNTSCKSLKRKNLLDKKLLPKSYTSKKYHLLLSFNIEYTIEKNLDISGVWGTSTYQDIGDNISKVEYELVSALFYRDSLLYMGNQKYRYWFSSKRSEKIEHEIPENIIDSLVTKSLVDYNKRLN